MGKKGGRRRQVGGVITAVNSVGIEEEKEGRTRKQRVSSSVLYMIKDLQASPLGRSKSNARGRKDAMLGLHTTYGSLCVGSAAQGKGGSGCGLGRVAHWGLLSSTRSESCLPLKTVGCPWAGHGYIIWSHLIFGLHLA